jgi:hypothetical protein
LGAAAQEKLMPVMLQELDSAQLETERQILYRQLLSGTLETGGMIPDLDLPEFDFQTAFEQYSFNSKEFIFAPPIFETTNFGAHGFYPSPFYRNGTVFSAASYQLNDKFKLGGYSFGANSVFSAPLPNRGMNNFDTRGATMFMEYKVSKNFKIETRISVTQGNAPGF